MVKKFLSFALLAGMVFSMTMTAYAEDISYEDQDWKVYFTSKKKMETNFDLKELETKIMELQPGDTLTFSMDLENQNKTTTNWYLKNEVLKSLEEQSSANGGAYDYTLTYTDPENVTDVVFSSDTVGGEANTGGVGLHGATATLDDFFYLDTLKKGEKGSVTLSVGLDGETQGNSYQSTLANLSLRFGVELNQSSRRPGTNTVVKRHVTNTINNVVTEPAAPASDASSTGVVQTGDGTEIIPYVVTAGVSGILLLFLALYGRNERRKEKEA